MRIIYLLLAWQARAADFSSSPPHHHMAGMGPQGTFDLFLALAGLLTVAFVSFYTVKLMVNPRERDADHIKRRMLRDDF